MKSQINMNNFNQPILTFKTQSIRKSCATQFHTFLLKRYFRIAPRVTVRTKSYKSIPRQIKKSHFDDLDTKMSGTSISMQNGKAPGITSEDFTLV